VRPFSHMARLIPETIFPVPAHAGTGNIVSGGQYC